MGISALVFDFDGLLMDTESTLLQSWQWEWRRHGLELDPAGFFANHGGYVDDARYDALAAAVGPAYDREASHAHRLAYRERVHETLDLAPGIREWLTSATELGLSLAVATSSPRWWVEPHLTRAGVFDLFTTIAYGDEVDAHKPDPAVYKLALSRLEIAPCEAVAFEDTPHGIAAAKAAGLFAVAIPNPFADPAAFTAADLILPAAAGSDLPAVIGGLGPGGTAEI